MIIYYALQPITYRLWETSIQYILVFAFLVQKLVRVSHLTLDIALSLCTSEALNEGCIKSSATFVLARDLNSPYFLWPLAFAFHNSINNEVGNSLELLFHTLMQLDKSERQKKKWHYLCYHKSARSSFLDTNEPSLSRQSHCLQVANLLIVSPCGSWRWYSNLIFSYSLSDGNTIMLLLSAPFTSTSTLTP